MLSWARSTRWYRLISGKKASASPAPISSTATQVLNDSEPAFIHQAPAHSSAASVGNVDRIAIGNRDEKL